MEVSKREAQILNFNDKITDTTTDSKNQSPLSADIGEDLLAGENLIQTLVSLTGLPEGMANAEMDQILEISGHQPEKRSDITLEELRAALIAYLEALEPTCAD